MFPVILERHLTSTSNFQSQFHIGFSISNSITVLQPGILIWHSNVQSGIPIFGICIGHQLLALASGGETLKMQQGHRKGRSKPSNLREQVDEQTMKLWPTPNAWDGNRGPRSKKNLIEKSHQINLISAVKDAQDPKSVHLWPTPTARDYKGARKPETLKNAGRTPTNSLPDMVVHQMWPTPSANEHHAGRTWQGQMQKMLGNHPELGKTKESGSLNPTWVEWLMGYPKGWTDLKD